MCFHSFAWVNSFSTPVSLLFKLTALPDVGVGIQLAEVVPWSAAWRCGALRAGDIVITIDGETALFLSVEDVIEYLSEDNPSVEIVVVRVCIVCIAYTVCIVCIVCV